MKVKALQWSSFFLLVLPVLLLQNQITKTKLYFYIKMYVKDTSPNYKKNKSTTIFNYFHLLTAFIFVFSSSNAAPVGFTNDLICHFNSIIICLIKLLHTFYPFLHLFTGLFILNYPWTKYFH